MIHISDLARKLSVFFKEKGEDKFKVCIRVNFEIDVYLATFNTEIDSESLKDEFVEWLQNQNGSDSFYLQYAKGLKIQIHIVDKSEIEDDPYYKRMFADLDSYIDWGPRYRFDSLLAKKVENTKIAKTNMPPVVTFYSYKGGMGRTTTMIGYAMSLAAMKDESKRKRVVIIDCDLEAPGYLNFFNLAEHKDLLSGKKNGLVEYICDSQIISDPKALDINDYVVNIGLGNDDEFAFNNLGNIWLIPAGNLNEGLEDAESDIDRNDYLEGLAKINLSNVSSVVKHFDNLLNKINEVILPDIILIDSRTGFNDVFGTAALYLSSYVVGFFGFSRQTQPGLSHLLKEYYKRTNNFKLQLVFSIVPENDEWNDEHRKKVFQYIDNISVEDKDLPSYLYLHRNELLERIGTGDSQSDEKFVQLVRESSYKDYKILFERINSQFFAEKEERPLFSSNTPAIQLRNVILKHLKTSFENVSNFAEDAEIVEKHFFYRECMKELFDSKKFIIQGYKGTGKTYLYKALADSEITINIQKWARGSSDVYDSVFVNILPPDEKELVFENIYYGGIDEPDYYFNAFWQIYTWNALLLQTEFSDIKENSALAEYILPLSGMGESKDAYIRIDGLIKKGIQVLALVEKDLMRINEVLSQKNKKLFVLYDRLDTCINPLRWNKAVSPLINYWRNNCESFSNIVPKIFVRTDLFKQIEGTNTARLENSIIRIEWSIGEVFGYFFKLIFSNPTAANAYWAIAEKVGIDKQYIKLTKQSFEKFPQNQFKSLLVAEMSPIIKVFFGKIVNSAQTNLGTPWEYFERELANADRTAISLRPFINTLSQNAVDKALAKTEKYVKDGIIPSEIYASKAVREETTEKYFNDLTQDAFSKDLLRFRDVIRTAGGEEFRFKSLTEIQFEKLISMTLNRISESPVVKDSSDLKRLIFANGIMAEHITTKGRYYRFAPIYWYSWGLANSAIEKEEKKAQKQDNAPRGLEEGMQYEGVVVEYSTGFRHVNKIKCKQFSGAIEIRGINANNFYADEIVIFTAAKEQNKFDPTREFWFAKDVHLKDED